LKARYALEDVRVSGNSVSFADAAGNEWHVTLRDGRLQGMVSSPNFSGEVDLNPASAPPAAAPQPSPSPAPPAGGAAAAAGTGADGKPVPPKSSVWKGVGGIVAANVVGLGALVGLNKVLNDTKATNPNAVTCSPRTCVAGAPGAECQCNINLANGASCGNTATGIPYAGICSPPTLPCQSDLSCNNGLCETRDGRCPF
jgi:hypothetical protein